MILDFIGGVILGKEFMLTCNFAIAGCLDTQKLTFNYLLPSQILMKQPLLILLKFLDHIS